MTMEYFFLNIISSVFGTAFLIIFYIIQIAKTIRTKTAKGISWVGWSMLNLALACMFANSLAIYLKFGTYGYLVTESFNVGLALIELFLIIKYMKQDKRLESQG
ncbi:MAG: hypothetical protein ABS939_08270 [Psychrobacillus sp.]